MRRLLKVPCKLASLSVEGDYRVRVEIVTGAQGAVIIGCGVADRGHDQVLLGVHREGRPHRAAAVLGTLLPAVSARLVAGRDDVEGPVELSGLAVERVDMRVDAPVGAAL